jgi:hypothetical protein
MTKPSGPAGSIIRGGKDGLQLVETKGHRWTQEAEALFLDHLAASCNVRYAAKQVGFSTVAIYNRKRSDPGFTQRWDAALAQGYARLEMMLVQSATDRDADKVPDPEVPFPDMTVREAITILQLHRASVTGDGTTRHAGWRGHPRKLKDVKASIIAKLEAIESFRKRKSK